MKRKGLLFDITGKRPLKRQGKERAFSQKECEKILQNMSNMIQEVEDYMLDLNCIELRPEYIYEDSKGEIQWIYFPQTSLESEIKLIWILLCTLSIPPDSQNDFSKFRLRLMLLSEKQTDSSTVLFYLSPVPGHRQMQYNLCKKLPSVFLPHLQTHPY